MRLKTLYDMMATLLMLLIYGALTVLLWIPSESHNRPSLACERCKLGTEYVSLATMAEAARRLRGGQ